MLRTNAARAAFRALNTAPAATRSSFATSQNAPRLVSQLSKSRPTALSKPLSMALTRYQTSGQTTGGSLTNPDKIDSRHEQEVAKGKLRADPSIVSSTSSTHAVFGEVATPEEEKDVDMMAGVKGDLVSYIGKYTSGWRTVD